jgi:tripartite-type tricarboxylate transporter receptor subunit TctC
MNVSARWLCASAMALGALAPAAAQDFPSRTVKIVMGFGPGGLGDLPAARSAR